MTLPQLHGYIHFPFVLKCKKGCLTSIQCLLLWISSDFPLQKNTHLQSLVCSVYVYIWIIIICIYHNNAITCNRNFSYSGWFKPRLHSNNRFGYAGVIWKSNLQKKSCSHKFLQWLKVINWGKNKNKNKTKQFSSLSLSLQLNSSLNSTHILM